MSYKIRSAVTTAIAATCGLCTLVLAGSPAEMQHARHEHYEALGDAFKAVRDQSKASTPDWAALEKAASTVNEASVDQMQWFAKGTGPEAGKTRALAAIWEKPDEFAAAAKMFAERAPKLLAAAQSKSVEEVNKAFREVGGACRNCHDSFRSPDENH